MSFRLVQRGTTPLVVMYLVGPGSDADHNGRGDLDDAICAALPGRAIVATVKPDGALTEARAVAGVSASAPFALVGWSAGCQAVRQALVNGAEPVAVVTLDGTHASMPPASWQLAVWRDLASEARRGVRTWVATCILQRYTETKPGPYMATASVLAKCLDVPELAALRPSGLKTLAAYPGPPVLERHEGSLHLLVYNSTDCDAAAHSAQVLRVLPEVLREIAPVLDGQPTTDRMVRPVDVAPPVAATVPADFGFAVDDAMAWFQNHGWREHGGMNRGKEIEREFLAPLGLPPGSAYCAASISAAMRRAELVTGLRSPIKGTGGALAMMRQFQALGLFTPIAQCTEADLRRGNLLFSTRGDPQSGLGHVADIIGPVGNGSWVAGCREGNSDRVVEPITKEIYAVVQTERPLSDARITGIARWS